MHREPECLDEVMKGKDKSNFKSSDGRRRGCSTVLPVVSRLSYFSAGSKIKELTRLLISGQLFV